jgi:hypothetical protein
MISRPYKVHKEVVQYDFKKTILNEFERINFLNISPTILFNSIANLRANYIRGRSRLPEYIFKFNGLPTFARENAGPDILYEADYNYKGEATYEQCSRERTVHRQQRNQEILVHYGIIASGN